MNVLCLDSGSSSLKHALYEMPAERLLFRGAADAVGNAQQDALDDLVRTLRDEGKDVDAVGHRIVFGGPDFAAPLRFDASLFEALDALAPLDESHLPSALGLVRAAQRLLPAVPHVACFDSAFHRRMPAVAQRYPLPPDVGPMIRRYGYHGLSYEYIVSTGHARGRTVIAHLGSGASLAAVRDGQPVDTTMGFSPLGGMMMGSRAGDLDPGVLLYLLRGGSDRGSLTTLLNERSGLAGVSGGTSDMRTLEERAPTDAAARRAVELFVYIAVKHVGAMAAALRGLDTLIFTGGIGERSAHIRQAICESCAHLGVMLDPAANERGDEVVSSDRSAVAVRVIATNENVMIARHVFALVR